MEQFVDARTLWEREIPRASLRSHYVGVIRRCSQWLLERDGEINEVGHFLLGFSTYVAYRALAELGFAADANQAVGGAIIIRPRLDR